MPKRKESWIARTYYWVLWWFGFADTDGNINTPNDREKITFMLRRMKERMGLLWWLIAIGSILAGWTLTVIVSWWYVLLAAFQIWLFIHVLWPYTPPDKTWGGKG